MKLMYDSGWDAYLMVEDNYKLGRHQSFVEDEDEAMSIINDALKYFNNHHENITIMGNLLAKIAEMTSEYHGCYFGEEQKEAVSAFFFSRKLIYTSYVQVYFILVLTF